MTNTLKAKQILKDIIDNQYSGHAAFGCGMNELQEVVGNMASLNLITLTQRQAFHLVIFENRDRPSFHAIRTCNDPWSLDYPQGRIKQRLCRKMLAILE